MVLWVIILSNINKLQKGNSLFNVISRLWQLLTQNTGSWFCNIKVQNALTVGNFQKLILCKFMLSSGPWEHREVP